VRSAFCFLGRFGALQALLKLMPLPFGAIKLTLSRRVHAVVKSMMSRTKSNEVLDVISPSARDGHHMMDIHPPLLHAARALVADVLTLMPITQQHSVCLVGA
jgi:hypothetical protein